MRSKIISVVLSLSLLIGSVGCWGTAEASTSMDYSDTVVQGSENESSDVVSGTEERVLEGIRSKVDVYNTEKEETLVAFDVMNVGNTDFNGIGVSNTASLSKVEFIPYDEGNIGQWQVKLSTSGRDVTFNSIAMQADSNTRIELPKYVTLIYVHKNGTRGSDDDGNPIFGLVKVEVPGYGVIKEFYSNYYYDIILVRDLTVRYLDTCLSAGNTDFTGTGYEIVIPSSITELNASFAKNNTHFRAIYAPSVTNIRGQAFSGCTNLEDVYFPKCKEMESSVFKDCISLGRSEAVGLPIKLSFPVVQSVGSSAFENCSSMAYIDMGTMLQTMGNKAFYGDVSLQDMDLTGGYADGGVGTNTLASLPNQCFSGCTNLKNVKITSRLVNIGNECFYQCDMRDFTFENTKLQTIGSRAFWGCSNLDHVALPDTVASISNGAFQNCYQLRYIYSGRNLTASNIADKGVSVQFGNKDNTSPDVVRLDSNISLKGQQIYQGGNFVIYDAQNDVKEVVVSKDGDTILIPCTEYIYKNADGIETKGYMFSIEDMDYGKYSVAGVDILGNSLTTNILYETNYEDTTRPVITVDGESRGSGVYKTGVKITVTDDLQVGSVTLSGKPVDSEFTIDEDGTFTIKAIDTQGNESNMTIIVDGTAPNIKGIEDTDVTAKQVILYAEDSNLKSFVLNGNDILSYAKTGYQVAKSGVYVVEAMDAAGNYTKKKFTYSTLDPTITGVQDGVTYATDVTVSFSEISGISEAKITHKGVTTDIVSGTTLSAEGDYTLKVTSGLKKSKAVKFTIDKTPPTVTGVVNGMWYRDKVTGIKVTDGGKSNGVTYTIDGDAGKSSVDIDGKHTLVATDSVGNKTTLIFYIDKTAPKVKVSKKGKVKITEKQGIKSVKVKYKKTKKKKYKIQKAYSKVKKSFTLKKKGYYTIVVEDMAGWKTVCTYSKK